MIEQADPLTVIGGIASIAALLSQVIGLIQKIQKVRADVAGISKTFIEKTSILNDLLEYLQLVQEE
jgi:hypothetical protein